MSEHYPDASHLQSKLVNLRVCSINNETLRGKPEETADMLECSSVAMCFVQETRFRGKSIRMFKGKSL